MNTEILSALIASFVSIAIASISFMANRYSTRFQQKKLEINLQRRLTEKLYDKRMEKYPKGFDITDMLRNDLLWGKRPSEKYMLEVRKKIINWFKSGSGFYLSKNALKAYYSLRDILNKKPKNGNQYNKDEISKIWNAKNKFRSVLRKDVNLLYAEERMEKK